MTRSALHLRLALIDNYDSYTYNLSHLITQANQQIAPTIILADQFKSLAELHKVHSPFDAYILSPGPGNPENSCDFPPLEREILLGNKPVLAVCLGHQALCATFGASVTLSPSGPAHGAVSIVRRAPTGHDCPLMRGLPLSFKVVRYHSLVVDTANMSDLLPTAWAVDDSFGDSYQILMAVRHRTRPLFGLQFHPESICTQYGNLLAANFITVVHAFHNSTPIPISHNVQHADENKSNPDSETNVQTRTAFHTLLSRVEVNALPERVFRSLFGKADHSFWLDSCTAVKGMSEAKLNSQTGRFSVMGAFDGPRSEIISYDVRKKCVNVRGRDGNVETFDISIFDYLSSSLSRRHVANHPDLPVEINGGYFGFLGYDLKALVAGVKSNAHRSKLPDAWYIFADRLLIIDHGSNDIFLVAVVCEEEGEERRARKWFSEVSAKLEDVDNFVIGDERESGGKEKPVLRFTPERSRKEYLQDIGQCLHEITNGESYEICLTNRLRTTIPLSCNFDPLNIYCTLRLLNPAPYAAFLRLDNETAVCCSSPERYLQITSAGLVESKPIKGTLPRATEVEEDNRLRDQLQNSEKDRRENLMIVDLVRNDLSRSCKAGSVRVPKLMHVESYATVHQLVSTVTGNLIRAGDAVECTKSAYPMGSMTGAPKVRTMEIIDRLEHSSRGIYSGSIGYFSLSGAANLNVVIRTAILKGRDVEIGVGGAIVALSDPKEEYEEVILKGKAIMQTLALQITNRSEYIVVHEQNVENGHHQKGGTSEAVLPVTGLTA